MGGKCNLYARLIEALQAETGAHNASDRLAQFLLSKRQTVTGGKEK